MTAGEGAARAGQATMLRINDTAQLHGGNIAGVINFS